MTTTTATVTRIAATTATAVTMMTAMTTGLAATLDVNRMVGGGGGDDDEVVTMRTLATVTVDWQTSAATMAVTRTAMAVTSLD